MRRRAGKAPPFVAPREIVCLGASSPSRSSSALGGPRRVRPTPRLTPRPRTCRLARPYSQRRGKGGLATLVVIGCVPARPACPCCMGFRDLHMRTPTAVDLSGTQTVSYLARHCAMHGPCWLVLANLPVLMGSRVLQLLSRCISVHSKGNSGLHSPWRPPLPNAHLRFPLRPQLAMPSRDVVPRCSIDRLLS